jgi:ubiquinone/menaquinone biosynthesis C-methylase UbiE
VPASNSSFEEFERRGWSDDRVAAAYHDRIAPLTRQTILALLGAAEIKPAMQVLDVATGGGYLAAAAAERGAQVIGIDISPAQLALARKSYNGIEFREGDAGNLPFPDETFDAVLSNFGLPHFPDRFAFMREAYRVLRRGARLGIATWASRDTTIGLSLVMSAIERHGHLDVGLPPGPGSFPEPGELEDLLHRAGFKTCHFSQVTPTWYLSSPDELVDTLTRGGVRIAAVLRAQTPKALVDIRKAVREALMPFWIGSVFEVPMGAVIAVASRPN